MHGTYVKCLGTAAHVCILTLAERLRQNCFKFKAVWVTKRVPVQQGLQSEPWSQNKTKMEQSMSFLGPLVSAHWHVNLRCLLGL